MNDIEFSFLDVDSQVKYYNSQLKTGKSLTAIAKELELDRNTIRERFKYFGFIYNRKAKKYELHFKVDEFGAIIPRTIEKVERIEHVMMLYPDGTIHDGDIRKGLTE